MVPTTFLQCGCAVSFFVGWLSGHVIATQFALKYQMPPENIHAVLKKTTAFGVKDTADGLSALHLALYKQVSADQNPPKSSKRVGFAVYTFHQKGCR